MKRVDVAYVLLTDAKSEKVLMVKNAGKNSSYYTLPGGAVEYGETLQEAAMREVKEETGLEVKVDGIFSVMEAFFEERNHHAVFFTFSGNIVGGEINISFPEEIEEVTWMDLDLAEKFLHLPMEVRDILNKSAPYILRGNVEHNK
ncbi:NUDIX domain-containing protein [Halobacillus litoralis]|uniref:NUDIX domain-containing protein n=1 Tax=Halobacillus litoralis TaxID=45668 RepID=A0A845FH85_9BACI|nr:NUDIX hydrolase [Halobacillus litoralis]MYL73108.1 NUDIX domain-containing protein [Halobacillus litoralis]